MSNGFENVIRTMSAGEENARTVFESEISHLAAEYPEEKPIQTISENVYAQDEENMKGNGHSVQIISDSEIMSEIMKAVDESEHTTKWEYIGDNHYVLDAKSIEIHEVEKKLNVEITRILKRPYDEENPWDDDSIYDVYMVSSDGDEYVESLEIVAEEILLAIYFKIIDNAN